MRAAAISPWIPTAACAAGGAATSAPFVYAGVAIVKPELVARHAGRSRSRPTLFYDRAIAKDRLYGLQLDGQWLHVGEPQAIAEAEECLAASKR